MQLRPGNAGSNTAADHIAVIRAALRQLPTHQAGRRAGRRVLIRIDGAGATHELLDWLVAQRLSYSVGFTLPTEAVALIEKIPATVWDPGLRRRRQGPRRRVGRRTHRPARPARLAQKILAGSEPRPRVLVLTTFDLDEYVYEALMAGASGFLLKDVPEDQLIAAIRVVADGGSLFAPSVTRRLIAEFARRGPRPPRPQCSRGSHPA